MPGSATPLILLKISIWRVFGLFVQGESKTQIPRELANEDITTKYNNIIESVDSISRDGPDMPIHAIQSKSPGPSVCQ